MAILLGKFLCVITGAAFFLLSDAVPTQRTANPISRPAPLSGKNLVPTVEQPKIVWATTDKTRHETGGSEGCFGISTGSGGADLFALSPNVVAITFPEYGCKGQPMVAVCGTGVADRLQRATTRSTTLNDLVEDDSDDDVSPVAPVSACSPPSTSCTARTQSPVQAMLYDDTERAFRGTALQRPGLKTLGCTAKTSSIHYTAERASLVSEPGRLALEEYSSFMSLRMPEPAVAKSVFLARVDSLGAIPAIQPSCVPAQYPATETAATVPCPETPPAPAATGTVPAVMETPISGNFSAPGQTLTLECPMETGKKTAGVPASVTSPATFSAPALVPGPVIVSASPPEVSVAPARTAARMPAKVMATPAPVVYVIHD